jgi:competence protein ComEA
MRTAFSPALTPSARVRSEATAALVQSRVDTLFGAGAAPIGGAVGRPVWVSGVVPSAVSSAVPSPPPGRSPAASVPVASPDPPPAAPRFRQVSLALKERWDLDRRATLGLAVLLVLALGYGVQHF